jgi:diguanylate cyclase (GGDEF)-like protein
LSICDPLTGLLNLGWFRQQVDQALDRSGECPRVAVVLIGIDRFRVVNDSLGHSAGDALLVAFADRLQIDTPNGTVGRVGGDVFAVVIDGVGSVAEAVDWARRRMHEPGNHRFVVKSAELYVAYSAGVAFSGQGDTAEDLVRNADLAMSRAKQAGGGQVVAFEERDLAAVRERLALECDLRQALAEDQIYVAYQPVVRTDDYRVIGAEALARWDHPVRGQVAPDVFLPVLAGLGLASELTSLILRRACTQAVRWRNEGKVGDDFQLSVNLFAEDLVNPGLVEDVRQALEISGLEPGLLALEVTETGLIRDTETALECLKAIRRLGPRMAVDDFGTGYSSLSYLNMFPVDIVKIDKSFVLRLGRDADATALVRGILSLTRALGLTAVAEGIENHTQLETLRQLGCTLAQGYFWCPPVPPEDFPSTLSMLPPPLAKEPLAEECPGLGDADQRDHLGWAVFDELPTAVAVVDASGKIMATNLAWKRFVLEHGGQASDYGVGGNYLAGNGKTRSLVAEEGSLAARGLRAVLVGDREPFAFEYNRQEGAQARRYLVLVSPVAFVSGAAVVSHLDITERH